jgi:hypothetical protein
MLGIGKVVRGSPLVFWYTDEFSLANGTSVWLCMRFSKHLFPFFFLFRSRVGWPLLGLALGFISCDHVARILFGSLVSEFAAKLI